MFKNGACLNLHISVWHIKVLLYLVVLKRFRQVYMEKNGMVYFIFYQIKVVHTAIAN